MCLVSVYSWIVNGIKVIKRLFTNRKYLTVIPGISFYMRRIIKLLLLIKPLTNLFTSSCENPAACQDKLPVMFLSQVMSALGLPKPLYLLTRHSSFKSSWSILGRVYSHAGHCFQVQHLSFSSSFFKTYADVFLITEHYIQTRLKSS